MSSDRSVEIWTPSDLVTIPTSAKTPDKIVLYGRATLSQRDMASIVAGFNAEGYEMVSTFVWAKASAVMKHQVATLGMEFVGEMLGRPDLDDDSDPTSAISDREVISLAEDLGMITTTQALRLTHAIQLINHFTHMTSTVADHEGMQRDEAVNLLRTCISSVLGKPQFDAALKFADFRRGLRERTLKEGDSDVSAITTSPYFFVRTTLSVLLAMVKGSKGAAFEHAVGNTVLLVPLLWDRLRESEKWQVGQAYAEVNASGNRAAATGLKKALVEVHGFDFVPESLRSSTFTEAAAKVLAAHFAINNFYNEREPMAALANLGTSIPLPAFGKCMEATLAVRLGNFWGVAFDAQQWASKVLESLRPNQWEYYLNNCLPRDKTVLEKLSSEPKPVRNWIDLIQDRVSAKFEPKQEVKRLFEASVNRSVENVTRHAKALRVRVGT